MADWKQISGGLVGSRRGPRTNVWSTRPATSTATPTTTPAPGYRSPAPSPTSRRRRRRHRLGRQLRRQHLPLHRRPGHRPLEADQRCAGPGLRGVPDQRCVGSTRPATSTATPTTTCQPLGTGPRRPHRHRRAADGSSGASTPPATSTATPATRTPATGSRSAAAQGDLGGVADQRVGGQLGWGTSTVSLNNDASPCVIRGDPPTSARGVDGNFSKYRTRPGTSTGTPATCLADRRPPRRKQPPTASRGRRRTPPSPAGQPPPRRDQAAAAFVTGGAGSGLG